jgi:hypothetical protein
MVGRELRPAVAGHLSLFQYEHQHHQQRPRQALISLLLIRRQDLSKILRFCLSCYTSMSVILTFEIIIYEIYEEMMKRI